MKDGAPPTLVPRSKSSSIFETVTIFCDFRMMQFPSDTSVLDDVEFMQNNYGEYFHTLEIIDKSDEAVRFRISPVDESKR